MDNFDRLQKVIKKLGYGKIEVTVHEEKPVKIKVKEQTIKINNQEQFEKNSLFDNDIIELLK
jgi:hypothetical protein